MVKISSNSIDELNLIYKKIKKDFSAKDSIKLNQESLEYELHLERPELSAAMMNIADKIIELDEMLEDRISLFRDFTWLKFKTEIEKDKLQYMALQPLKSIWRQLQAATKQALYRYLCQAMEIEPQLGTKLVA